MKRTPLIQLLPLLVCGAVLAILAPLRPEPASCGEDPPRSAFYAIAAVVHVVFLLVLLILLIKVATTRRRMAGKGGWALWPVIPVLLYPGWIAFAVIGQHYNDDLGFVVIAFGLIALALAALVFVLPSAVTLVALAIRALTFRTDTAERSLRRWYAFYTVVLMTTVFLLLPASLLWFGTSGPGWC